MVTAARSLPPAAVAGFHVGTPTQRLSARSYTYLTFDLKYEDVLAALAELIIERGSPAHVMSDDGSGFIATAVQDRLQQVRVTPLYIAPSSPWRDGYDESFKDSLRDELLDS